jgi:predicted DNA-binding transcriptional regulator AlpA
MDCRIKSGNDETKNALAMTSETVLAARTRPSFATTTPSQKLNRQQSACIHIVPQGSTRLIPWIADRLEALQRQRQMEEREPLQSSIKPAREPNRGDRLLTPQETADFLRVSLSWLAKARMRGDGPPYVKIGRAVRYPESPLRGWMKAQMHLSTSER